MLDRDIEDTREPKVEEHADCAVCGQREHLDYMTQMGDLWVCEDCVDDYRTREGGNV